MSDNLSKLDYTQVIKRSGVALDMSAGLPNTGLGVLNVGGTLVPEAYDELDLTYVGATDKIQTVTFKLSGNTIATLTLTYDGSDRITNVVRS